MLITEAPWSVAQMIPSLTSARNLASVPASPAPPNPILTGMTVHSKQAPETSRLLSVAAPTRPAVWEPCSCSTNWLPTTRARTLAVWYSGVPESTFQPERSLALRSGFSVSNSLSITATGTVELPCERSQAPKKLVLAQCQLSGAVGPLTSERLNGSRGWNVGCRTSPGRV